MRVPGPLCGPQVRQVQDWLLPIPTMPHVRVRPARCAPRVLQCAEWSVRVQGGLPGREVRHVSPWPVRLPGLQGVSVQPGWQQTCCGPAPGGLLLLQYSTLLCSVVSFVHLDVLICWFLRESQAELNPNAQHRMMPLRLSLKFRPGPGCSKAG